MTGPMARSRAGRAVAAGVVAGVMALALAGAVLTGAALPAHAAAVARPASFGDANRDYKQGRFPEAIREYQALVTAGIVNQDLYYNLGNAYFRTGELGKAIYNYERALRIDPGMEDAQFNMGVARKAVAERVVDRFKGAEADPWWVKLSTFFSLSHLTVAFLVCDLVFFACLVVLRFLATGFARTALAATTAFIGVALVGSLLLLRVHIYVLDEVYQGVVVADQVVMREGADAHAAEKGKLHPGVRVRLRGQEPGWLHIRLANGMEGWVPADSIGVL